jgi:hypothetical protein
MGGLGLYCTVAKVSYAEHLRVESTQQGKGAALWTGLFTMSADSLRKIRLDFLNVRLS